ncbi:Bug family tripartite tricarboxylate transporter substrate binding protein [Pseudaquabacterium inlustre]|uniref:Bug family tripartite tricarboxylate transporter substrate binding protein n=1 Tax=Pseudaquabacterium inlustre TaxID=2984192 RepID=UPI003BF9BBCC
MDRRSFAIGAGAALAAPALQAQTPQNLQALPNGPVRIVVGFPPGGGTDTLARVLAPKLQEMWKLNVIVDNKAGAAGVLAAEHVAKQPGDGSTLLMAHINSHAIAPALNPKLSYNPETDFSPLTLVGVTPNLLIGNTSQTARTLPELIAACKAQPGQVTFGSSGPASAQHLALELFKHRAKVFALHIPYRGSGPLITDLIGGQVQYSFETMTAATPHVKSGKVIAIAQTRPKRSKAYPDVPTVAEAGLPDFDATTWYGLAGPKGMPAVMVKRMSEDIQRALALPDVQERLAQNGAEDGGGAPERFAEFMRAERSKYSALVKAAGIKIDS